MYARQVLHVIKTSQTKLRHVGHIRKVRHVTHEKQVRHVTQERQVTQVRHATQPNLTLKANLT
jgi:hypothetical protein